MDSFIKTMNLTKKFNDVLAVDNVNLEIEEGIFYGITGRSGSGKTTLLSILGMLDKESTGKLYINGIDSSKINEKERALIRMNQFGFVFQDYHLNPLLKAFENVMIPMLINPNFKNTDIEKRAIELMELFELNDRINNYPSQLSGGEKQRVALARALANNPKCILADEPTGNLDVKSEKHVFDYLKMLVKKGKSVIVVSHNPIIYEYADRIYTMNEGKLEEKNEI